MEEEKPIHCFPGKTESVVWNDFGFYMGEDGRIDKSQAICRLCHKGVKYLGNTTNLHRHLAKHRRDDTSYTSSGDENVVSSGQSLVTNFITNANRSEALNLLVGEFLIENMLSPDIVETQSFVNMLGIADPTFQVQPKQFYSDGLLTPLYVKCRSSLTDIIRSTPTASLTVDFWESKSKKTYMTTSAHIINNDWKFESYVVSSKPKPVSLAAEFQDLSKALDLQLKPLVVVGDPSVIEAPPDGIVIECLGLAINRAAMHVLNYKHIPKCVKLARKIAKYSRNHMSVEDETMSSNCDEHWIVTFEMMNKTIQNREKLASSDVLTTSKVHYDELLQTIEHIVTILKPLKLAVDHMLQQPEMIVSLVLPILRKLETSLSDDDEDACLVKELKSEMRNSFKTLYQSEDVKDFLLVSCLLDPLFKELLFVDVSSLKRAREKLSKSAIEVSKTMTIPEVAEDKTQQQLYEYVMMPDDITGEPSMKRIKAEVNDSDDVKIENNTETPVRSVSDWLSDIVSKKAFTSKEGTQGRVNSEIERYLSVEQSTSFPLSWWQSHQSVYPILARVARQFLCTPAMSLPPDVLFNVKSHDVRIRRHALPDKFVDKMVFLNSNYHKLKD